MHRLRWRRSPIARVTRSFVRRHGLTVQAGPFAGMVFPGFAIERGELVVAQLLGAYERELHPAIKEVIDHGYDQVVDIGASDGYYAVGLARSLPASTVYAYELNPFPTRVCQRLAEANDVADRVIVRGECRLADLQKLPTARTFVLSDCEGCERTLMDPDAVPLLRRSSLIVELHEHVEPSIEDTIRRRFSSSHDIEIVHSEPRYIMEYPVLGEIPNVSYIDQAIALSEWRPCPMKWAVMNPKPSSTA